MLDRIGKDVVHEVPAEFARNPLPTAKPDAPYVVRPQDMQVLTIDDVATKATVYNIGVPADTIKVGLEKGLELVMYLMADGYVITTELFTARNKYPGGYKGTETGLTTPAIPVIRVSQEYRDYVANKVEVKFVGVREEEAWIKGVEDLTTGSKETLSVGRNFALNGYKIKIAGDSADCGLFILRDQGGGVVSRQRYDEALVENSANRIVGRLPDWVHEHEKVWFEVVTEFTGSTLLKAPRVLKFEKQLTVVPFVRKADAPEASPTQPAAPEATNTPTPPATPEAAKTEEASKA